MISYNNDNRQIKEKTGEDEMMIHINGPEVGEADETLKAALTLHSKGNTWHFTVDRNIFRSSGITTERTLKRKSNLPFFIANLAGVCPDSR